MTTSWRPADPDRATQDDPAYPRSRAALRAALEDVAPPGDEFSRHIAAAIALLNSGLPGQPPQSRLAKNSRRSSATRPGWVV
jgi:hypothetical protein